MLLKRVYTRCLASDNDNDGIANNVIHKIFSMPIWLFCFGIIYKINIGNMPQLCYQLMHLLKVKKDFKLRKIDTILIYDQCNKNSSAAVRLIKSKSSIRTRFNYSSNFKRYFCNFFFQKNQNLFARFEVYVNIVTQCCGFVKDHKTIIYVPLQMQFGLHFHPRQCHYH